MSVSDSNNSIRIRTTPLGSDRYVKVNINQNFDFLEILSLRIGQEEIYRKYCSDYGVIAGRVVCNKGVGVPNAKISVFIPISDEDLENSQIRNLYPFESLDDVGLDGLKYNLLTQTPRVDDICHTAIGSFPEKRRMLDCEPWCEIYGKYYRYTTSTNASGDYMIFGVPTGVQVVHMDVDLSDIGYLSQKPYDMIRQGSSEELFESWNKFASAPTLNQLPQVKTQNKSINVLPFWGNLEQCEVGINRVDFDLNYDIQTSAFFIGSIFGDSEKNSVNKNCRPRKKLGYLDQLITGPGTIEMIRRTPFGGTEVYSSEGNQLIDDDGVWIVQVPMNLEHKITDEFGNLIDSGNPLVGIATRGEYRFRIGMNSYGRGIGRIRSRAKYLVPNYGDYSFDDTTPDFTTNTGRPNFATLLWNGIYTVKQFITRYSNRNETQCKDNNFIGIKNVFEGLNNNPFPYNRTDRNTNPLFNYLCLLLSLIVYIVSAVNAVFSTLNVLLGWLGVNVPCVALNCPGNSTVYAPGCYQPSNNQTIDNDSVNDTIDCLQISLADALNVFSFYFTNDWINGTLYAFLFKYKYKKNGRSKFCDAEIDQNSQYIKDQVCSPGGQNPPCELVYFTEKGVVLERDFELYYAAIIDNHYLFATDIYDLGSMKICDYFGRPRIVTEIPTTTFNSLELADDDSQPPAIPEERGVDDLLIEINCLGLSQSPTQCKNTSRICEIDVNTEIGDSEPITNDSLEDEGREVRMNLICLNSGQCNLSLLSGDGGFLVDWRKYRTIYYTNNGYIDPNANFDESRRHILQRTNKINNSFYFYFGLTPGKTAIDKFVSKYFAPCERKEPCPIVINGEIENNKCIGGNVGSIKALPEGGTPPYRYSWFNGDYGDTMTPICIDFTFSPSPISLPAPNTTPTCIDTISNLYSGKYTVVVKDNVGQICKKTFVVEDPTPFNVFVNYSPYICPNTNNGFIEIIPTGGNPPYGIHWTGGTNVGTANTGNFFIYNLGPTSQCTHTPISVVPTTNPPATNFYFATVYDSSGQYGCINISGLTIDITQACGLTVTGSSTPACSNVQPSGTITWGPINGGVPPFIYILESTTVSYYWSGTSYNFSMTKEKLQGDNSPGIPYRATIIDSCGFSSSTIINIGKGEAKAFPSPADQRTWFYTSDYNCSAPLNDRKYIYFFMVEGPNGGSYTFTNGCPYNSGTGAGGYYGQIDSTSYGYVNASTTTTFWYILPPLDLANPTRFLYISDSHGISCNLGVSFRREPIVGNTTQDRVIISYNANNPQYFTIPNGPFLIDKNNDLMIHTMFGNQISDLRACSYSVLDSKCNNVIQSGVNP